MTKASTRDAIKKSVTNEWETAREIWSANCTYLTIITVRTALREMAEEGLIERRMVRLNKVSDVSQYRLLQETNPHA